MKERDYSLVSALQRLRAAQDLVRWSMPHLAIPAMEKDWKSAYNLIEKMVTRLERAVDREMEDEASL